MSLITCLIILLSMFSVRITRSQRNARTRRFSQLRRRRNDRRMADAIAKK